MIAPNFLSDFNTLFITLLLKNPNEDSLLSCSNKNGNLLFSFIQLIYL